MSRIQIAPLGVDSKIASRICSDPELSAILWYFILDHPADKKDEKGILLRSVVSIKELCDKTGIESEQIAGLRVQRLIDMGVIEKYTPEFFGGQRMPSSYQLNFQSELFLKARKRSPAKAPEFEPGEQDVYEKMIEFFIVTNQSINNQTLGPKNQKDKSRWMQSCHDIMKLEVEGTVVAFDITIWNTVVKFLANQLNDHLNKSDKYAMRVFDIPNMLWRGDKDPHCKFIKAWFKAKATRTRKEIHGERNASRGHGDGVSRDLGEQIE